MDPKQCFKAVFVIHFCCALLFGVHAPGSLINNHVILFGAPLVFVRIVFLCLFIAPVAPVTAARVRISRSASRWARIMKSKRRSEESETSRKNNRGREGNPRRKNKRRTREEETSRKNNRWPRGGDTQGGGGGDDSWYLFASVLCSQNIVI